MPMLDRDEYLHAISADGRRLAESAARAGLDAPVPSCPGWAVRDLLSHMVGVYRNKEVIIRERLQQRPGLVHPDAKWGPDPHDDVVGLFWSSHEALCEALRREDPTTPVWTWYPPDQSVQFWLRRMAHETVVHRVDADLAAGDVAPIHARVAADGIDELLDVYLPTDLDDVDEELGPGGRSVHLHAHDGAGEWVVHLLPRGIEVVREHAKGDVAVRGSAEDLLTWLYGRADLSGLDVVGDVSAAEELRAYVRIGTQ